MPSLNPKGTARKELAAWVKKFPDEFYENIYKLKDWTWPGMSKNRFSVVGHYTDNPVFERMALARFARQDSKGRIAGTARTSCING